MSEKKQTQPRHVDWVDIGLHTADGFGYTSQTLSLTELINDPPSAHRKDSHLLSILVFQQSALIKILNQMKTEIERLRTDIKQEQTRVEAAREKAAKAEEKAAIAREKAAQAEALAVPPNVTVIQAGRSLRRFETRIKHKF